VPAGQPGNRVWITACCPEFSPRCGNPGSAPTRPRPRGRADSDAGVASQPRQQLGFAGHLCARTVPNVGGKNQQQRLAGGRKGRRKSQKKGNRAGKGQINTVHLRNRTTGKREEHPAVRGVHHWATATPRQRHRGLWDALTRRRSCRRTLDTSGSRSWLRATRLAGGRLTASFLRASRPKLDGPSNILSWAQAHPETLAPCANRTSKRPHQAWTGRANRSGLSETAIAEAGYKSNPSAQHRISRASRASYARSHAGQRRAGGCGRDLAKDGWSAHRRDWPLLPPVDLEYAAGDGARRYGPHNNALRGARPSSARTHRPGRSLISRRRADDGPLPMLFASRRSTGHHTHSSCNVTLTGLPDLLSGSYKRTGIGGRRLAGRRFDAFCSTSRKCIGTTNSGPVDRHLT